MGDYVNSQQVRFDKSHISCGVLEAHHLPKQPPGQTMFAILTALYHKANPRPAAFVIFSDVVGDDNMTGKRGELLAAKINEQFGSGKGTAVRSCLWQSDVKVNPRSGNQIRVWVWTPDHEVCRKWYQQELANRVTEEE